MTIFAAAIAYTNDNFTNTQGTGDWSDGLCLAPIIFSLLYNPIALVMHLLFRNKRPIHPAIRIGLDLVVWGLSVPAIVFGILGGVFWYWTQAIPNADGSIDCTFFFNTWSETCTPVAYQIGRLEIAGLVLLFFIFIIHITLFVFACIDLQRKKFVASLEAEEVFDMEYRKDIESRSQGS
ncbi:MAG: hypothetical protein LQ340_007759 [Diploschistes diacapsis]|nr:MAG: hypothetical protein LQ340_007759 [Diploschistes diacapsis]